MDGNAIETVGHTPSYARGTLIPVRVLIVGTVALVAQNGDSKPVTICLLCVGALLVFECAQWVGCVVGHVRARRHHYQSGDAARVEFAVDQELHAGMAPGRLRALALAGLGDFAAARRLLMVSSESDAEDHELDLCAHIVMCSFEGRASVALTMCRRLLALPMPSTESQRTRRKVRREGIVALARAVSGSADESDYLALSRASTMEPSLYWACRYGAAVACCAKSETQLARRLVRDAPVWPKESAFRGLHSRIEQLALG